MKGLPLFLDEVVANPLRFVVIFEIYILYIFWCDQYHLLVMAIQSSLEVYFKRNVAASNNRF